MNEERKAVITVREYGGVSIEFFPEVQRGKRALHELLGLVGFMAIVKANREREELDCESQGKLERGLGVSRQEQKI